MSHVLNDGTKYDIFTFLSEHIVKDEQKHTHTSMFNPKGSYYINENEIDILYELYEKKLFENADVPLIDRKELHITERHEEISPIIIDLDFRYSLEVSERQHTIEHIKKIIELYVDEISSLFDIEKSDKKLTSFVFERNNTYKTNDYTKDGIHILFPFIISYESAQSYIRNNILKKISDVISDLPYKNAIADIVDRSVIKPNTCWLLYGSNKDKPKGNPYILKYIFDDHVYPINIENYEFSNTSLVKFFSIRGKKESQLTPIKEDKIDLVCKADKPKLIKMKLNKIKNYDSKEIREIVLILNEDRCNNYMEWIEIGWALHNLDHSSQELLDIWIEFSKKSSKYKEGECEKEWAKMKNEGKTEGSLHHWAKIDNFEKWKAIKDKNISKYIQISTKTSTNYDIAYVLFMMYRYEFKYSGNEWYIFKNHTWNKEQDGMSLRQKISTELFEKFMKVISDFNAAASSDDINITEEEKEEYKKKSKDVFEITKLLKTTNFKDKVMKECTELFHDKEFMTKLDENHYLIGFANGIYDLKKGELRDGRPDDFVEMNTGIDKIPFSTSHEYWFELHKFISTVFVSEEIRSYFLTYFATCLQGHNAEEKFRIWTGVGSNGKSKILELFVHALGMYAIKFPITLLTGKRAASNSCTPEVVQSKGKRFGYFEEPSENERINAGLLKEFSGGDKIKARGLHKEPIEFKPQFKLALLCNDIPELPPNDEGTWRRMEVIEFKSRFCEHPKESNEFPIDKQLSEKLKNWSELFIALLLDKYYENYKKNDGKFNVPEEVTKFTKELKKQSDLYTDFITDNIEESNDRNDSIDITLLYDEFKIWYQDTFNNNKIPSKVEFKKYLIKKYGKSRVTTNSLSKMKFKLKESNTNNSNNNEKPNLSFSNKQNGNGGEMSGY